MRSNSVLFALAGVVALSLLALYHQPILLTQAPFDIFMPLDAGLRIRDGLWPSLDYPCPIGPLYAAVNGLAMWLVGVNGRAVMTANILVLALNFGLLAIVLRGATDAVRLATLLIVACCLLLPVDLDTVPPDYRYVTNYNNWCWAFMAVTMVWALRADVVDRLDGVAVGLALVALFFIKLSVFLFAMPMMVLGLLCERRLSDYRLPALILAGAVLLDIGTGHFIPYLQDNVAVARATGSVRLAKILWQIFAFYNVPATVVFILVLYRQRWRGSAGKVMVAAWLLLNLAALQNNDKLIPVIALPMLLVAPRLLPAVQPLARLPAMIHAVLLVLVVGAGFAIQPVVAKAVHAAPFGQTGTLGSNILLSSMRGIGDWRAPTWGDSLPHTDEMVHVEFQSLEELLAGRHGRALALEFSNAALASWPAIQPAPHAPLWYDINRSFSPRSFAEPISAFRGLDFILAPKRHRTENTRVLVSLYQPWLDRCTTLVTENELWRLYVPKGPAPCQ